jgi:hypothetical protein
MHHCFATHRKRPQYPRVDGPHRQSVYGDGEKNTENQTLLFSTQPITSNVTLNYWIQATINDILTHILIFHHFISTKITQDFSSINANRSSCCDLHIIYLMALSIALIIQHHMEGNELEIM